MDIFERYCSYSDNFRQLAGASGRSKSVESPKSVESKKKINEKRLKLVRNHVMAHRSTVDTVKHK